MEVNKLEWEECFFTSGTKSFDVSELSDYWYEILGRRKNQINRVTFDRRNIWGYANVWNRQQKDNVTFAEAGIINVNRIHIGYSRTLKG